MKTRIGFVSNSSSSSFVIAKTFLNDKQIKAIKDFYAQKLKSGESFGENGEYFEETDKYLSGEYYYISDDFHTMIKKNKIPEDCLFTNYR